MEGPTPYKSDIVVPYKYNDTMVEDSKEIPISSFSPVVNIGDVSGVTQYGRVFASLDPKRIEVASVG